MDTEEPIFAIINIKLPDIPMILFTLKFQAHMNWFFSWEVI